MRKFTHKLGVLFAAVAAAGLTASATSAQNLDLEEMAAGLALPVITGGHDANLIKATRGEIVIPVDGDGVTLNTVTNGKSTPVLLKVDIISGDPNTPFVGGDNWQSDSFDCLLTGRETTTFVHVGLAAAGATPGINSVTYVECSTPLGTDGLAADNKIVATKAANGILWVAAADPATGKTVSEDILFGDAVVVDVGMGQAYSFGAIPFQAGNGFNNGNKIYRFDNEEYAKWPSVVATNYIAPDAAIEARIQAELILFTLDGTTGNPTAPRVAVGGLGYDDDENFFDFQHEFDCFDIVALTDMSANFSQVFNGGSLSGHLQLVPQPVATANDVHDAAYGDANNSRRRPVHGWIVQSIFAGVDFVLAGQPALTQQGVITNNGAGPAAWGRPLAQGRGALMPFGNDLNPTLDADPLL